MHSRLAPDNKDCSSPPASSSRNHRLRSRGRRKKSVDDNEQASRHLELFQAHIAHSLDSIMEDSESGQAEMASILPIRRMRKAQTESCLSQLDSSQPHTFAHRLPATKLENEDEEWKFGIDETLNMPPNNDSKP